MEEITIKVDVDVSDAVGAVEPCENCVREYKDLISNGKLPNIRIPKGLSLLIVPDHNSAGVLTHYHIELMDRRIFRKFPHPMQWKCPVCGKYYMTRGRFINHLAKEYKIPTETIALLDDALMQKGFKKALKKKW